MYNIQQKMQKGQSLFKNIIFLCNSYMKTKDY